MSTIVSLFDKKTALRIAKILIETQAIQLNPKTPFVWASGLQSPIYCDNRITLSFPKERNIIKKLLVDIIIKRFPDTQGIIGVATAGIPQGVLIAETLDLPFLYVRSSAKKHGTRQKIEGVLDKKKKYIIVEDLISTGKSALNASQSVKNAGGKILGMLSTFTYGFEMADNRFQRSKIPLYYLCNYDILVSYALMQKQIDDNDLRSLNKWRENPKIWKSGPITIPT